MADPSRKTFDMGGVTGVIYTFARAHDVLPMHQHEPGTDHISIIGHGSFLVSGASQSVMVGQGQVIDFLPRQPHEFIAMEDDSVIINVVKG